MSGTSKRKTVHKKEASLSEEIKFCGECQEDLNNFDIDPMLKNKKEVLENHVNCKKIGKFKGDKCSKLFIEEADDAPLLPDEEEEDFR